MPGRLGDKAVAEWAPNIEPLAVPEFLQPSREFSFDEVDHVDAVAENVVHGERAADERIVEFRQAEHQKLSRKNAARDFWAAEADPKCILGKPDVFHDFNLLLASGIRIELGMQWI